MIVSVKEPGFPGFFILGVLGSATVWHPLLAQNRSVSEWKCRELGIRIRANGVPRISLHATMEPVEMT